MKECFETIILLAFLSFSALVLLSIGFDIGKKDTLKQPCYCAKQVVCGVDMNTASQSGGLRYETNH